MEDMIVSSFRRDMSSLPQFMDDTDMLPVITCRFCEGM